jgi:hypothetical protein
MNVLFHFIGDVGQSVVYGEPPDPPKLMHRMLTRYVFRCVYILFPSLHLSAIVSYMLLLMSNFLHGLHFFDTTILYRRKRTRLDMAMLYIICLMFALSTALWGLKLSRTILELAALMNGTSNTKSGMAILNSVHAAWEMADALSLINVS